MEFEKIKLKDFATITMGQSPKSEFYNNESNGLPFLQGVRTFGDIYPTIDTYTIKGNKIAEKGDILFTVRAPVGDINIAPEKLCIGRGLAAIKSEDQEFLYYLLKNNKQIYQNYSTGTIYKSINKTELENLEFNIPDYFTRKRISKILVDLDKKIEINNKIIENLEAQAQAIFKSWFVDFEPFQDRNFVESELGLIPEGWEVGKLGKSKLGKIIGSGIDEFNDEKIYLATANVSDTSINNISTKVTFDDRPSRANMQPKPLSVWFAKMKDSRKLIFVDPTDKEIINKMIFSTGFAGIQANENSFTYLWAYLLSDDFDKIKNAYAMGTTMQAINNKNINNILIAIPTDSILKEFSTITKPMIENISNLRNQNEKLAQTRDTLLPKLMSGEIDVSNIKIDDEDIDYE